VTQSSSGALFVAGAGTEIGKTYVTAALTRHLVASGRRVLTLKPVASGVPEIADPGFAASDTGVLLAAQGLPLNPETVAACTPWRFLAPLAPDLAAAREGRRVDLAELVAWCGERRVCAAPGTAVVIEGVGGLMSPLTAEATGLDWLKALRIPSLLVAGSYLGAISHALTAVETLRAHSIPLTGIAVSESLDAPTTPEVVADAIARRVSVPVAILHRGAPFPEALAGVV